MIQSPSTWCLEVANAFALAVRGRRVDAVYRDASLNELSLLPITIDADTSIYAWSTTLRIAERLSLTAYDAAFLELAQRRNLSLATANLDLRAAAPTLDIELLGVA